MRKTRRVRYAFTLVELPVVSKRERPAFTLVELLVVIGIIAVLVGILLPVLGRARGRAYTVSCQSNLHQIFTAARNYSVEYGDSMPFGMIFAQESKTTGRPVGSSDYITWFSSLDRYMLKGAVDAIPINGSSAYIDGPTRRRFNKVFKCPAVQADQFRQQVTYYNHPVAMPHMPLERMATPAGQRVIGPMKFTELYPENAVFWDTICWGFAESDVPSLFWLSAGQTVTGYTLPASWVDFWGNNISVPEAGLLNPKAPELRYRGPGSDRFAQSTNPLKDPAGPIAWYAYETLLPINSEIADANQDTGWGPIWYFSFGSPRWRHNGNTTANVAFADGSVRSLRLNIGRKFTVDGDVYYDNEFRRRMLMTKWPKDKKDSGTIPTN